MNLSEILYDDLAMIKQFLCGSTCVKMIQIGCFPPSLISQYYDSYFLKRVITLSNIIWSSSNFTCNLGYIYRRFLVIYRVSRYLAPPLPSITGQGHTPNLYISMIPHQFQIYMQDFRSPTWFTYFRWHGLWCGVEYIFVNKFCLIFGGALTKMAIKLSIIGADPYMTPHFKAHIFRHAVKL